MQHIEPDDLRSSECQRVISLRSIRTQNSKRLLALTISSTALRKTRWIVFGFSNEDVSDDAFDATHLTRRKIACAYLEMLCATLTVYEHRLQTGFKHQAMPSGRLQTNRTLLKPIPSLMRKSLWILFTE